MRCAGDPLARNRDFFLDVAFEGTAAEVSQLHLVLLTPTGEIVGSTESGRRAS